MCPHINSVNRGMPVKCFKIEFSNIRAKKIIQFLTIIIVTKTKAGN